MLNFLKIIQKNLTILSNILTIKKKSPKIIFYSESKSYQKYSYLLLEVLARKYPNKIWYVSSDQNDFFKDLKVNNLFIGKGLLMQYFFLSIKAESMILTITDLNNHQIKKTKNINNYIYYFHAPGSTTKVYTETAFDNYDTILCNGDYQLNEIKKREESKNLPKKKLIKSGYFYFDYLMERINKQFEPNEILVAPSWNYSQKNFINNNFEQLMIKLIEKGYNVRFRPHPENLKRSKPYLNKLITQFKGNKFIFDDHPENLKSMENAKYLITDASGIAIEYVLMFQRPVLYLDDVDKVHNNKFFEYEDQTTMDQKIKDSFGYTFKKNEFNNIDIILSKAENEFKNKQTEIENFLDNNFYNFNETKKKLDDDINRIL
mgnify:CR=1 FL=1